MLKYCLPPSFTIQNLIRLVFLSCFIFGISLSVVFAEVQHLATAEAFSKAQSAQSIFVDVQTSTWKPRGRIFWDVEGGLRSKLRDVGFNVVRNVTDQHVLTLTVNYQESKGESVGINRYRTVIVGSFLLKHQTEGYLLEIRIHESALPSPSGIPPYLDVLHNFLTNPYYHYLGEIVWGELHGSQDPRGILLNALMLEGSRMANFDDDLDTEKSQTPGPHYSRFSDSAKKQYAPVAVLRTIDEFVKAKDSRIVKALKNLQQHPDLYVQVRSVEAFGDFGVTEALPYLTEISQGASQVEVRSAAKRTIKTLKASRH